MNKQIVFSKYTGNVLELPAPKQLDVPELPAWVIELLEGLEEPSDG